MATPRPKVPKIKASNDVAGAIRRNRVAAIDYAGAIGHRALMVKLERARRALEARLKTVRVPGDAFTPTAMRASMAHIRAVTDELKRGVLGVAREGVHDVAGSAYSNAVYHTSTLPSDPVSEPPVSEAQERRT